jgi:hypothetical protein
LLFGEEDDTNKLPLECEEVGPRYADRYAVCLAEGLEEVHPLLAVDLDNGRALEDRGSFVDRPFTLIVLQDICLLDHRDRLSS